MLVLALDVGTSSTRATCFDTRGRAVPGAEARVAYEAIRRRAADVLGVPVTLSGESEASARGAALLALEALGAPAPPPLATGRAFVPDAARHSVYREARQRLYDCIVGPRLS